MLTAAALGLAGYGLYSAGLGLVDLFGVFGFAWWADLSLIALGLLLTVSAAFVRVRLPGGVALAVSMLLALQGLALYTDSQTHGAIRVGPQVVRAVVAVVLVALAFWGAHAPRAERSA